MKRLVIGITGASGVIYGIRALQLLKECTDIETHLIMSPSAVRTIIEETDWKPDDVRAMADKVHSHGDIGASISSGSYKSAGMIVMPCSIKTLSGIANCYNEDLITRAADVCLKEHRRVVLLLRETPLHAGHVELMAQAIRNGAIIAPPVPAFYRRPKTVEEIIDQTVGRVLDFYDIDLDVVSRWGED